MEHNTINRSVLETSTIEFKQHFRQYLKDLAQDSDPYRVELIEKLEWCFDRWEYWRQKFFPNADLVFPFFQSMKRGSEFGHYSTCGSSGQPSVIHIRRAYLMGESDITVWKLSPTKKLVLKKDHPERLRYVDQTILHELVHQFLHEGAEAKVRRGYASAESGRNNYKGHGPLFAAECNRINKILHPELGFDFVPVRHSKRSHAKVADKNRPSCAQFTHGELLFCWDPTSDDLTSEQIAENRQRLEQALAFYGGAVELVQEAEKVESTFEAPYASDCADVCIQQLKAFDEANGTALLDRFIQAALEHAGVSSIAPVNIPPASGENGNGRKVDAVPESGPTVPKADCPVQPGDTVTHPKWGTREVTHVFAGSEGGHPCLALKTDNGPQIVRFDSLAAPAEPTVPSTGDGEGLTTLAAAYPVRDPELSLRLLQRDLTAEKANGGTAQSFAARRFGHKNGQQLSRHVKRLKDELRAQTGIAA
jgi:hypothetical protein